MRNSVIKINRVKILENEYKIEFLIAFSIHLQKINSLISEKLFDNF